MSEENMASPLVTVSVHFRSATTTGTESLQLSVHLTTLHLPSCWRLMHKYHWSVIHTFVTNFPPQKQKISWKYYPNQRAYELSREVVRIYYLRDGKILLSSWATWNSLSILLNSGMKWLRMTPYHPEGNGRAHEQNYNLDVINTGPTKQDKGERACE